MDNRPKSVDRLILFCFVFLSIIGLIIVFSTTNLKDSGSKPYMINQLLATILGIISIFVILKLKSKFIENMYIPIYIFCVTMLVWVLFSGIGETEWGSKSWIRFKFLGFQPSEIVKLGYILFLSKYIANNEYIINSPKVMIKTIVLAAIPVFLIFMQPDLGTSIVYLFIFFILILSAHINKRYITLAISMSAVILPIIWMKLDDYQKKRFYNFINPSYDLSQSGYQVAQSKKAIATSGLFGKKIIRLEGSGFIDVPENHNDFIYSAVVESFGIIGGIIVIILFIVLIYKILINAQNNPNKFQSYALKGFAAMFFCHFFESIAMSMGAMPVTGIPLPFISYGGTFQLMNFIAMGFVLKFSTNAIVNGKVHDL